jgi:uncharacterized protein (TIGR02147 family)
MAARALVDVFGYRDYRAFLGAYYERRKAQKGGYSFAEFSREVGLRSPNYLKLVIDGGRNLTPEMAQRFAEGAGLRDEALDYFCELVAFNQARTARARDLHYRKLQSFRRFRAAHKLDAAQSAYHSQWFIPVVYELVARDDFDESPRWLARAVMPPISPKQASQALSVLQQLGLLKRDPQGKLVQAEAIVETPDGPLGHHIVQFHRMMLERAAHAMDSVPRDDREIAGLTLCVSDERMRALKSELEQFRQHLLERYMQDPQPERVVQVNLQMFPLSAKKES